MLLTAALIALTAFAIISWIRVPRSAASLGSMSERWLAEHRASHAS
jgi:hypothetical protein